MLEALGVYTSKTFSVIETGEELERNDEPSPTRSAVLVRLGHSHVRFGVFQRLAFEKHKTAVDALIAYCARQFEPDIAERPAAERATALFGRIVAHTARLAAQWMAAGFVHGVLNTDNMNVTGESFDYGPWRFLPAVDYGFTAAYFDQTGLYAYGRQPDAAAWNLSRLGGVFALVAPDEELNEALQSFGAAFRVEMGRAMSARLGLKAATTQDAADEAGAFAFDVLQWMETTKIPFERMFFDWFGGPAAAARASESPHADLYADDGFAAIKARLVSAAPRDDVDLGHAYFSGAPTTMLIDEVEALWDAIDVSDDWRPLEDKITAIRAMGEAYGLPQQGAPLVLSPAS